MTLPIIGEPKTFYFSKDELKYLRPRYEQWQKNAMIAESLQDTFQSFIIRNVLVRLGITDFSKYNITLNIEEGTLQLEKIPEPPKEEKPADKAVDPVVPPPPPPNPKSN